MMMDDSAPTHKRRKLVKTYKICSLKNGLWLLKYVGRPTLDGVEKLPQMLKKKKRNTPQNKGECRERERENCFRCLGWGWGGGMN